jgi:hypothetical protein
MSLTGKINKRGKKIKKWFNRPEFKMTLLSLTALRLGLFAATY